MTGALRPERIDAIDHFRGMAIIMMVLADYLDGVEHAPAWLKHPPDVGLTVIDLIAPFFLFAIGLTFGLSYRRRVERSGVRPAVEHVVVRYLALAGIGLLLDSVARLQPGKTFGGGGWGVLQAIAVAGLLTLPLLGRPPWVRVVAGLTILAAYQGMLERSWRPLVTEASHGGIIGSLSWGALMMMAAAMGDWLQEGRRGRWQLLAFSAGSIAAGLALSPVAAISKHQVSATYVLVGLGASGLLFMAVHGLDAALHLRLSLLAAWGRNPLLLYVLHLVVLIAFVLPPWPWWYLDAPLWLAAAQAALLLALLSAVAWALDRKGWYVSL